VRIAPGGALQRLGSRHDLLDETGAERGPGIQEFASGQPSLRRRRYLARGLRGPASSEVRSGSTNQTVVAGDADGCVSTCSAIDAVESLIVTLIRRLISDGTWRYATLHPESTLLADAASPDSQ
jgi:hypothetical protein